MMLKNCKLIFILIVFLHTTIGIAQQGMGFGLIKDSITHENIHRSYYLHLPTSLKQDAPLVVVLHGFTSSAENIMEYSKFNQLADQQEFAVLYPQGTIDSKGNTFWNVGYSFHETIETDDVEFIATLTQHVQKKYRLSSRNTFLTGMSNGGEMCYLMACRKPSLFRAIAPVAGMMLTSFFEACESSSTPVFAVFGTNDDITNFKGDPENKDGWGAYISIPETIDYWAKRIDFDEKNSHLLPDLHQEDGSSIEATTYLNSKTQHKVQFYKVINGGHDWPGAWGNKDVVISEAVWRFFREYID